MKLIKQISVFVENKSGRLSDILNVIGKNGIDISALSIADTTDFGIVRMIVNDPDKAAEILKSNNLVVKVTDVIALAVADKPGGLAGEIEKLKNAGISIEYMYAFIGKSDKGALVIVRVENPEKALEVLKNQFPLAIWETVYVTLLSTLFAIVIGLPLGVLLVAGENKKILRIPQGVLHVINVIINLLRSVPFLILMIMVFPLTRLIVGTVVGTPATVVPLVIAAFPFVARLVESSLREINPSIIEAAQSMGASPFQIIAKVMIPESVPSLISNGTIALTTVLGYSAMSGIIGGGGLGKIAINYGYYRYQYLIMVFAVVFLIILVQIFQSLGTFLAAKCDKRLKNRK